MNAVALISAILFGTISPLALELPVGMRDARAVLSEECVLVAVLPESYFGYGEKTARLQEIAKDIAEEQGKSVLLTEDFLTYLILIRMEKRGADEYERKNLVSRLAQTAQSIFFAEAALEEVA